MSFAIGPRIANAHPFYTPEPTGPGGQTSAKGPGKAPTQAPVKAPVANPEAPPIETKAPAGQSNGVGGGVLMAIVGLARRFFSRD